jgi:hypothetical protein
VLYSKPAKLLIVKYTVGLSQLQEAIIDRGSQLNLISALLAKEQGLEINPLLKLLAKGVNGSKLLVYSTTIAEVNITDS